MIIKISNLTYQINGKSLFTNINMDIKENTIVYVSGNNNCGKTTLIRILEGQTFCDFLLDGKCIKDYSKEEIDNNIQAVYPLKTYFKENNIVDEVSRNDPTQKEKISFILNELNLNDERRKKITSLSPKEIVKLQIAKAIVQAKKLVLIDEIDKYFNNAEIKELLLLFKECITKYNLTFLLTAINLDNAIYADELYIINDGKVLLSGDPLEVLQKDNIIAKAGLKIPFMIELSVKLKDYDLIKKVELNKERLINSLWK